MENQKYETVAVLAISNKPEKEKGWIKISPIGSGSAWSDLGAHFPKSLGKIFDETGLYDVEFQNVAKLGENSKYEVVSARKLKGFEDLLEYAKQA